MSTPSLPVLTKWPCADTCITAYDGFCERFTYTGIWPATAQCLLSSCSDADRLAVQETVAEYCDAVGYPDIWGPYMWGASSTSTAAAHASTSKAASSKVTSASAASTLVPTTLTSVVNEGLIATGVASSSSLASTTTAVSSSDNQTSKSGVSTGAKVGIGIGIAAAFILMIVLGFVFFRWRRKQQAANFPEGPDHFATPTASPREKEFGSEDVIIYTIEDGALKKRNEKRLSIKIL